MYAIDSAVLRLHVFYFLYILQPVDGTSEVYFPDDGVGFVPVLPGVHGPRSEQCSVALSVVAALLGVNPRHFKDVLLLVQPLQPWKYSGIYLAYEPIPHARWWSASFFVGGASRSVDWLTRHACLSGLQLALSFQQYATL